jgi:GxxExxY protein
MLIEMSRAQLSFESERCVKLTYKSIPLKNHLRLDLLVQELVVVELKAVECVHPIHLSQVLTYLKLTDCPAGLLPELQRDVHENGGETPRSPRAVHAEAQGPRGKLLLIS